MKTYLDLLRRVMDEGVLKQQRAAIKDGSRPMTRSLFGAQVRYDLAAGFPLVTTKRMPFNLVINELLWYLSGSTNNKDLVARGVTVWNEWADPETGDLGPVYGQQWRRWPMADGGACDQVARLLADIRAVVADPEHSAGRRLIVSAWNAPYMTEGKSPKACHTLFQFNVTDGRLSCQLYQRSADMFLGVPWNIACYAALTHLLAHLTGLAVGEFVHTFGDAHIYGNHLEAVQEQLQREPRPLPTLAIAPDVSGLDGLRVDQFVLSGYSPHPAIRGAEVAV